MKNLIIFTDLDGTLLDYDTYSFEKALPALQLIREKHIPLVICSSKTRIEIEHYRKKLGNSHPFISENGGGIFIPKNYFNLRVESLEFREEQEDTYTVIRLGARYDDLRKAMEQLRSEGFNVRGFGDMTVKEISDVSGLSIAEAAMAKERDFDEPFFFDGENHELPRLFEAVKAKGLKHTQGRFLHILGNSDKGRAAAVLIDLYKKELGEITTLAIGDSLNDVPMLEKVDCPVIVRKHDGEHDERISIANLVKEDGTGPEGWARAVLRFIGETKN
ncbi:MAG: HAD-IIB family hydrolase [Nitrospiraceae bacterium]|nr:MAG: HAD-IIB family hydrolase [Nitrospiraceae bacterium]